LQNGTTIQTLLVVPKITHTINYKPYRAFLKRQFPLHFGTSLHWTIRM